MKWLALGCSLFLCFFPAQSQIFEPQIRGQKLDSSVFWSDGRLLLRKTTNLHHALLGYAVLKSRHNSKSQLQLLKQGANRIPIAGSNNLDYLLVPINHGEELAELASLAHEATGTCGSIEFIKLDNSIKSEIQVVAPIYASHAVFPDLQTLIDRVELESLNSFIDKVTSLVSRYYKHPQGEQAHTTIHELWSAQMRSNRWTITEHSQAMSGQKSIIARLTGTKKPEETLIVGAHLDSIVNRGGNSKTDASAGADDNASGIAVLTEILRIIESSKLELDRSLELHAYAAEEVGLIGSREIASQYAKDSRIIAGMMQVDMAYYSPSGSSGILHLLEEFTSRDLRRSAIDWIRRYLGQIYKFGHIPHGASSDHKSFWEKGYPTLFAFENPMHFNPHIHTGLDTSAQFDDGLLIKHITKLALLFVAYQGGLSSLDKAYEAQQNKYLPIELNKNLTLAIQTTSDGFYLAVAAPSLAHTLEFCEITAGAANHCKKEREVLDKNSAMNGKKFFYSANSWALSTGQQWRIFAYDKLDELIAWRQFRIITP